MTEKIIQNESNLEIVVRICLAEGLVSYLVNSKNNNLELLNLMKCNAHMQNIILPEFKNHIKNMKERDAVISYGMDKFLKERLMCYADPYSTYICGNCGMFARTEQSRLNEPRPGTEEIYFCPTCNNYSNIHQITIPYAFKLMVQELAAMNIAAKIKGNTYKTITYTTN